MVVGGYAGPFFFNVGNLTLNLMTSHLADPPPLDNHNRP